jgi:hypothetical protein
MKIVLTIILIAVGIFYISNVYGEQQQIDTIKLVAEDFNEWDTSKPPKEFKMEFSKPNSICKSGQCEVVVKDFVSPTLAVYNLLYIGGYFQVKDNITNKDLTPKKKELKESVKMANYVDIVDIKEDVKNNITIYYFEGSITFTKDSNRKNYSYKINGSYQEQPTEKLFFVGVKDQSGWGS